ncbi:MAG TPA: Asp23/Gls24 family envelope stress response protein [Nocardioidaceae bacterium]|jgi:uncharacterized alkaline shock family protein YloU|nr:Asp23/Gls24 family envelope stress response protein [Nocardioidaceae bacterium]
MNTDTRPFDSVATEDPGRLDVSDRVVEKVAGHAVALVPDAAAAPRRVLGLNVGEAEPEDAASVSAEVQDGIASVKATIAVRWPKSVQTVADEVRRSIRDEVGSLTGVQVDHVDVEVVSMTFPDQAEPRVS